MTLCVAPQANQPPVANNDTFNGAYNAPINGNVLTNDTDPNGDTLSASLTTGPAHGTVVLNPNGTFTYTPTSGFSGTDTFTYTVCMPAPNGSMCDTATETIVVGPKATDDTYATPLNTPMTGGDVTTGDAYPAGSTFTKTSDPAHGSVTWNGDGTFTYTPDTDFTGTDTFTYTVCLPAPDQAVCDTATHCKYGVVDTENCVRIQRLAALSYCTMGSPSLLVSHPPPKPA